MSVVLWLFGIVFGAIGAMDERAYRRMRRVGKPATGVVEDRLFQTGSSKPTAVMVRYVAPNGSAFSSKLVPESTEEIPQIGQSISIYYNPQNANELYLASSLDRPRRLVKDRALLWLGVAALLAAIALTAL
ncbi:DUF3592 domain-containing protein [Streptomyces sp. NPDC088810]|uniref:DUF3592 domain-containing protein n=1 Tax=Streptomyces sp. NPDC088810 TaxID=3365904 RepID=UPI00382EAD21